MIEVSITLAKLVAGEEATEAVSSRRAREVEKSALDELEQRAPEKTNRAAAFDASILRVSSESL